jgi:hypothetical protein
MPHTPVSSIDPSVQRAESLHALVATAVHHLVHPGKARPQWLMISAALLTASVAACAIMIWAGHARHGSAATYFREGKIGTYLSVAILAAAGVMSILTGRRLAPENEAGAHGRGPRFWVYLGTLMIVLAVDDLYRLHESIDHAWHRVTGWDPKHGVTASLDNWIVASYGLIAAAIFWRHRHYVARLGWFNRTMAAAFVGFAAMLFADAFIFRHEVEDSIKLVSGTLILCAFVGAYLGGAQDAGVPGR